MSIVVAIKLVLRCAREVWDRSAFGKMEMGGEYTCIGRPDCLRLFSVQWKPGADDDCLTRLRRDSRGFPDFQRIFAVITY